jgi:hypothetical protein
MLKFSAVPSLCAAISLCAPLTFSADFITGQAARLVVGQTTFTSQNSGGVSGSGPASNTVFGAMGGLAFANNTLFVADANRVGLQPINNRVLMFTNYNQSAPQPTDALQNTSRCPVCFGQATLVLGQPDFTTTASGIGQTSMNLPLGVASDGNLVAVADTANNRVLLWRSVPAAMNQPADIVLGQSDFTTLGPVTVTASSFRAPQGVWIQNGKLFVADTQNNRVLIWNSIPTKNNQPADLVLGQPNFTTVPQIDQTKSSLQASATTFLTPTSVSTDGIHLFVTDLGFSRVLIWNSIPTATNQPADLEVGQVDLNTAIVNNSFTGIQATSSTDTTNKQTPVQCTTSNGTDQAGNPTYPDRCAATMNFPRFAISDGTHLFVADAGNDRVLVWNSIPTQNGQSADVVLGEPDQYSDVVTSNNGLFTPNLTQSAADVTATPTSLAWDGTNLYVADPSNYRVLVFTPAVPSVQPNGVVNAASLAIYALGTVILGGTVGNAGDKVTVTINGTDYSYTEADKDTFDIVLKALATAINGANNGAGDTNVLAVPQYGTQILQLVARQPGDAGNNITTAATVSANAQITAVTAATLTGGAIPSTVAPGTTVAIQGANLCDCTAPTAADPNVHNLPTTLGNVQVYIDGIRAPLLMVAPTQINAQVPYELIDTNSSNLYVRIQHADGSVSVTDAVGLPVDLAVPGIFAMPGTDPRPVIAYHGSSYATGTISVDGSIAANDTATVTIEDRSYTYTVQSTDTLANIRDNLISLINANTEEKLIASPAAAFTRIRLQAKAPGPEGNSITIGATSASSSGGAGSVVMTALNSSLCCANRAGAPVTADNPAIASETIYIYATGLGLSCDPNNMCNGGAGSDPVLAATNTGQVYNGPAFNQVQNPVSSLAGGSTATVVSAGFEPGAPPGTYKVVLELGSAVTTNPNTQLTISQGIYTSNIVSLAVVQPNPGQ